MFKIFKSLFAADAPKPTMQFGQSPVAEIPGLRLGSTLKIDTLASRFLSLKTVLPQGDQSIDAYGFVDLGAGAELHRFYLMEDSWIQISTQNARVEDIKLFTFFDTKTPPTLNAFDQYIQKGAEIQQSQISYESLSWSRVWGEGVESPPVEYFEEVYQSKAPQILAYRVHHFTQLFEREIPDSEKMEYLLISGEDTDNEYAVVYSFGIDLNLMDLNTL